MFPENYLLNYDSQKPNNIKSAFNYINQYPSVISQNLNKFLKRFCDPKLIHYSCLTGFNLGRVSIFDSFNKLQRLKNSDSFYDSIYGLPRYVRGLDPDNSLLPNSKYNYFFNNISRLLKKKKIYTCFNSSVSIESKSSKFTEFIIKVNKKKLNVDNTIIIWTSDPNPLLRLYGPIPKSKPVRMKNLYYKREGRDLSPIYIQVFSSEIPITRIYAYQNLVTVESLSSKICTKSLILSVKKIMNEFLPGISFTPINDNVYSVNENRFVLFSTQEEEKMRELYINLPNSSIICSPWFSYGRDNKIRSLINQIDDMLL